MDKNKWLKWIDNIIYQDGENLDFGSAKTLGSLRKEIETIEFYTKEEFINLKGWNSYLLKQNEELQEDIKRLQKALESIERCSTNKRIKDIDLKARGKNET